MQFLSLCFHYRNALAQVISLIYGKTFPPFLVNKKNSKKNSNPKPIHVTTTKQVTPRQVTT